MKISEINDKIRFFIISHLDGFQEFTNDEKLNEIGFLTDDFFLNLIQFLEKEFDLKIGKEDMKKTELSIKSIGNFIEERKGTEKDGEEIDYPDLINAMQSKGMQ